jgi:putative transposase
MTVPREEMKAYKYKIRPSAKVEAIFLAHLTVLCELSNAALHERRDACRISQISFGFKEQSAQLPEIKKEREELARVRSQVVQNVLKRGGYAFENFFRRVKERKGQAGFPRFRSSSRYDSFTYPQSGFELNHKTRKLRLSKIRQEGVRVVVIITRCRGIFECIVVGIAA